MATVGAATSGNNTAGSSGWSSVVAPQPRVAAARASGWESGLGVSSTGGASGSRPQSTGVSTTPGSVTVETVAPVPPTTDKHVPENWEDDE